MIDVGYGLTFVSEKYNFDDEYSSFIKNTLDDFGLILTDLYIPEPEPKSKRIDIPFASGSVDVTDATGETPYNDRTNMEFKFLLQDQNPTNWAKAVRELSMYLHGKKMKMITEFEPSLYYLVRLSVDPRKSNKSYSTITLKGVADPYKYSIQASNEPWKWDPFSFVDGVIQNTSDLIVNGSRTITIIGGGVNMSPTFYVYESTLLKVTYNGSTYDLPKSSQKAYEVYRFPELKVGSGNAQLVFTGKGKVSIEYRGRYL